MAVAHARGIGFETEFRESTPVMTSMNLGAAKDLLLLYETLMDEEEQRDLLCQDQTLLNFLVYVLQETTDEIVMLSLKVLAALCADDNRCAIVSQTFGLSPSLELLTSGAQDFGVKEAALRLKMRLLEAKVALLARQQEEAAMADMRLSFRDSHSARKDGSFVATTPSPAKCPPFIGQHNGAAKVVSLHIEGLCSQSDRELCKEKLLAVRGVISFTFDIERRRCVVRVRSDLSARALIQAIKSTGTMSAMQVANSAIPKTPSNSKAKPSAEDSHLEMGHEAEASRKVAENEEEEKEEVEDERETLPAYLPEVDSPIREDAIVRQKKSKSSSAASWLGSAATFITKSLYW
ncbi:uncharacterized protein LOC142557078 isoform X2 [Dermacentor variabilis]|uniref:uncharacterized protein LOC142557078 isoform X2 n=1 Tax=Dermacentor variabilis TaxID=34621 RepID=UPI003F5BDC20